MKHGLCLVLALLLCSCSHREQPERASGIHFTDAAMIEEYLHWQVAEGTMSLSTNVLPSSNTITISKVWLNEESSAKFKEWLSRDL